MHVFTFRGRRPMMRFPSVSCGGSRPWQRRVGTWVVMLKPVRGLNHPFILQSYNLQAHCSPSLCFPCLCSFHRRAASSHRTPPIHKIPLWWKSLHARGHVVTSVAIRAQSGLGVTM